MAIQYEAAPVAKPAGGSSHDGYWSHNVDLDNRIPWNHQSTPPPPLIIPIILIVSRFTVPLPSPKGPSSSLRILVTLVPHLMLILILIPIGMQIIFNVRFPAVTCLSHMPGDAVMCFCPFL